MNVRGERILIFGDSLTQHASGQDPIWNVDQGPQRAHPAPGDLLASLLLDQGAAAVRTNALVSRSAVNFWTREPATNLIAADLAWRPTKIVFVLGTNDVGIPAAGDAAGFQRLYDAYKPSGAELWAIGPFTSRLSAAGVDQVAATMRKVFGSRFLDGRPLSKMISPGSDGVHYTPQAARLLALSMAQALIAASPVKPWMGIAIGAAVVIGGALIYGLAQRRGQLRGLEIVDGKRWGGSTAELVRGGYRQTPCKSGLDAKGIARCWTRGARGLGLAPDQRETLARVVADYKDTARRRGYDQAAKALGACDIATPEFIKRARAAGVPLEALRFDLTKARDQQRIARLYGLGPKEMRKLRREVAQADDHDCMFHEVAVTDDGYVIDWTANQFKALPMPYVFVLERGLDGVTGRSADPDDQEPGEDDEKWWERLQRQANAGRDRMREALEKHDAVILTTAGGRRVLVIKTPEVVDVEDGALRVTTFDEDGPIGHTTRPTIAKLAEEVHRDWHPQHIEPASEAAIMAWTGTERFARGAAAVAEVQRFNRRR